MQRKVALLGYGNIGQEIVRSMRTGRLADKYLLTCLWNRSYDKIGKIALEGIKVTETIEDFMAEVDHTDLVVECCHPVILHRYACEILKKADLFMASPAAFTDMDFFRSFMDQGTHRHKAFVPLGAAIAVNDLIRLDQINALKGVTIRMRKPPSSIRIAEGYALEREKLAIAQKQNGDVPIFEGSVRQACSMAPQNTNVMSIYALAASKLGFDQCRAEVIANRQLTDLIIELEVETTSGLKIRTQRINPAQAGAVTGTATFDSFIHSLHELSGISHNLLSFC